MDDHQRNDIKKLMTALQEQMRPAREAAAQFAARVPKIRLPDETVRALSGLQDWVKANTPNLAEITAVAQMHYRRAMADNLRDLTTEEWFAAMKMMSGPRWADHRVDAAARGRPETARGSNPAGARG